MSNTIVALGGTGFIRSTDNAVSWSSGSFPSGFSAAAIAWNGTVFCVAPGTGASTVTSPDGLTWTVHSGVLPHTGEWACIAWNGSVFCAIRRFAYSNQCATSPDGITWTQHEIGVDGNQYSRIIWNGHVFCALDQSVVATSADGIAWTEVYLPDTGGSPATDIASLANGTMCIVCGAIYPTDFSNKYSLASTDNGATWTLGTSTIGIGVNNYIASNGTKFVTVGYYDQCHTSTDGLNWTSHTIGSYQAMSCIAWNGSVFYVQATNSGPGGNSSPDGETWTYDGWSSGTFSYIGVAFDPFSAPALPATGFWTNLVESTQTYA